MSVPMTAHKIGLSSLPDLFQCLVIVIAGSLLFCPTCGTLLDLPKDGESIVTCEQCGQEEPASCMYPILISITQKTATLRSL